MREEQRCGTDGRNTNPPPPINHRFKYLHFKLSHIKKLVSDFDVALKRNKSVAVPNY